MFHFSSSIVEIAKKGRFPRHGLRAALDSAKDAGRKTRQVEDTTPGWGWFSMDNKIQAKKNSK